jgi:enamine deaminase RidA (YjgF/YER057c/UK114 family)
MTATRTTRRYSWPAGHWGWLIPVTHKHGLRCGTMAFVGGQVDKDTRGLVLHAYDLPAQTAVVMGHIRTVLRDLGLDLASLVKLVAFYASDRGAVDERALLDGIASHSEGPAPVITAVPVPYLAYPGMLVEIEAIAMADAAGSPLPRAAAPPMNDAPPVADGLRCGEMIYVSGGPAGAAEAGRPPGPRAVARAERVLASLGAALDDAVKLNVYYVESRASHGLAGVLSDIAPAFRTARPVVTAIPLPWLPEGGEVRIDLVAMRGAGGYPIPRVHSAPVDHWPWPGGAAVSHAVRAGSMLFVGAQMALDVRGGVTNPGALVAQTRTGMAMVGRALRSAGATLSDVVKVNTYYRSGGTAEDLNANLGIRSSCFADPGPTTTGIPVPTLAIEGAAISIDVWAMLD